MFCRLTAWLDSWSDSFNPITVRDLRRGIRLCENATLIVLVLLTLGFVAALLLVDMVDGGQLLPEKLRPVVEQEFNFAELSRDNMAGFLAVFPVVVCLYSLFLFVAPSWNGPNKALLEDELLRLVPLSPREIVHGYMASSFIATLFGISLCLPFVSVAYLIGHAPLWPLGALFGLFLPFQVITIVDIAFSARMKSKWDNILILLAVMLLSYLTIGLWGIGIILLHGVFGTPWPQDDPDFLFFSLWCFAPLALLVIALVFYRLALYHYARQRKPFWRSVLLNCGVFLLVNVILAVIYLGLALAWVML